MGYLDPYLRNNPKQVVDCDELYNLWLFVWHPTGIIQITTGDSDAIVSLLVKSMVPDVEDWQYGGDINSKYIFKFHSDYQRAQVKAFLELSGYSTYTRDFRKS